MPRSHRAPWLPFVIASIALGWYFNIRFVQQYANGSSNPIWGPGSWTDYIRLMFTNPAASSASDPNIASQAT